VRIECVDPRLDFAKAGGLLPAIVQHAETGAVLMLGYLNRAALEATFARRRVVFFSRSRQSLWEKGATSGNALDLIEVHTDCDRDALLIRARPRGPTCHEGSASCFGDLTTVPRGFLSDLEDIIARRLRERSPGSYTVQLAAQGVRRAAQKVGEEGLETALAAAAGTRAELIGEAADLLYHLLLLLQLRDVSLAEVSAELAGRRERSRP
jgi:phosphoribosyl-AMP cyclohydrolase / phosphoribosyl-ATP pyrophosphohydrolase